jgi:hypothetical protein
MNRIPRATLQSFALPLCPRLYFGGPAGRGLYFALRLHSPNNRSEVPLAQPATAEATSHHLVARPPRCPLSGLRKEPNVYRNAVT